MKTLIAYFSRTGITKKLAEDTAKKTGADLFAISASCVYAQKLIKEGEVADKVLVMVDDFVAQASMRIDENFRGVSRNADQHGYDLTQQIIKGEHRWAESGIVGF